MMKQDELVGIHTVLRQQEKPTQQPPEGYEWVSSIVELPGSDVRNYSKAWRLQRNEVGDQQHRDKQERFEDEWLSKKGAVAIDGDPRNTEPNKGKSVNFNNVVQQPEGSIVSLDIQGDPNQYYSIQRNGKYQWFVKKAENVLRISAEDVSDDEAKAIAANLGDIGSLAVAKMHKKLRTADAYDKVQINIAIRLAAQIQNTEFWEKNHNNPYLPTKIRDYANRNGIHFVYEK